jgi:hypothetical protein
MSRSAMQVFAPVTPPAARQAAEQPRQLSGVTCQAWANASRRTVVAASPLPRWMDGLPDRHVEPRGALQRAGQQVRSRVRGADHEDRLTDLAAVDHEDMRAGWHGYRTVWQL